MINCNQCGHWHANNVNAHTVKKVNNTTRASRNGTIIECPYCNSQHHVYHFTWSALSCQDCDSMVPKRQWLFVKHVK